MSHHAQFLLIVIISILTDATVAVILIKNVMITIS
ncbi:hypothetical protein FHS16_004390 [Paenibacillus endophyticus]|uniref:Uncharacterized protein n=1 Tax=Paenibacillus endophyticus TaxID=1294268 RepID=A0A7W5CAT6_9BACL|nr:hypothetical protein [Paenibacillus endophyticus]